MNSSSDISIIPPKTGIRDIVMVTRYDISDVPETRPAPFPPISHFPFRQCRQSFRPTFFPRVLALSVLGDVCYPRNGAVIGRVVPQKRVEAGECLFWRSMRHAFRGCRGHPEPNLICGWGQLACVAWESGRGHAAGPLLYVIAWLQGRL